VRALQPLGVLEEGAQPPGQQRRHLGREPSESRRRAVGEPSESRRRAVQRAVREPPESQLRRRTFLSLALTAPLTAL
jgi:hypothetical protein